MSCNKANNCEKYKINIGNPYDWESPCNRCNYNISDYDIGYNKAIDDFAERLRELCGVEIGDYQYSDLLHESRIDEIAEELKGGAE